MKRNAWIKKYQQKIVRVAPLFGLIALVACFLVFAHRKDLNIPYSMKNILNQSVVVAVISTGAIFIYTLGSFDISLGASACVSALVGAMAYNWTGSLVVMFLACVSVAVTVALANSVLASVFHLPVFVTTVAMLSVLNAIVLMLINLNGTGSQIAVPMDAVAGLNTTWFKLLVLGLFFAVCLFVFDFTKIGRLQKFLGGNPVCAKLTGIHNNRLAIVAFVMSGVAVGLGSFLSITYAPTLTKNTASSVGMDVIISIVFGGMPVSGGARSRIYAGVIGAFSMTFLNQIMLMFNLNSGIGQMVKAGIFLAVVALAMSNQRNRQILPR